MTTENETRAIVRETVRETLISLGLDPDDPISNQKNMAFLASWRLSAEAIKRQGLMTAVIVIVTGFLGLLWLVFIKGPPA